MNLLTSLHSIFQDGESLGQEEEVEAVGLEVDLEAARLEKTSDGGGNDSEREEDEEEHREGEEGHKEGVGLDNEGVGVMGLLQYMHPHTDLGVATLFALL
jgi:hypothetical protein